MKNTMIKKCLLIWLFCWSINGFAQNTAVVGDSLGIRFVHVSLTKAFEMAREQNKPIFMDCYTTWCGPCKYLSSSVFPDKSVGDFYNAHFVCLKFDMEKGEGVEIALKYKVRSYPTLLFISPNGEIMHRESGARDPKSFVSLGQTALNPEKNSVAIEKKVLEGNYTPEVVEYTLMNNRLDVAQVEDLLDKLFKDKSVAEWDDEKESVIILAKYAPLKSKYGRYIVENRSALIEKYGENNVNQTIDRMITRFYQSDARYYGYSQFDAFRELDSLNYPYVDKLKMTFRNGNAFSLVHQYPNESDV